MESSWRRSTLITLILAATMVVGLAGTAWADVSNITLTSPSSMVYVKAGDVITISGAITASSNGDSFWVNAAIGSGGKWYEKGWEDVGPVPGQSPYRSSYEVSYAVPGSVPEGTYRIRVQGRQGTGWWQFTKTVISSSDMVHVDNTDPQIGTWQIRQSGSSGLWSTAQGAVIEYRNPELRAPITDTGGSGNTQTGWESSTASVTGVGTVGIKTYSGTETDGELVIPLSDLPSGDHWLTLQNVKDRAGNEADISIVQFKVDTKPSDVAITGTPTAAYPNWSKSNVPLGVGFNYTSDPDTANSTSATVELLEHGTTNVVADATKGLLAEGASPQTGYIEVITPAGAADGTLYDVRLVVRNSDGASAPVTETGGVNGAVIIDNTAPTIVGMPTLHEDSPAVTRESVVYTNAAAPDLVWGKGDDGTGSGVPDTGAYQVKVGLASGGVDMLDIVYVDDHNYDSAPLGTMTNGETYYINVRVQDNLGNWSHTGDDETWYEGTFVYDVEGPVAPDDTTPTTGVAVVRGATTTYYTNNKKPKIDWAEFTDELSGMPATNAYEIKIGTSQDGDEITGGPEMVDSNTYTPNTELNLKDGAPYFISVRAYDALGNKSHADGDPWVRGEFVFDSSGPTFENEFPKDGYETKNKRLTPAIQIKDAGVGVDPDSIVWTMTNPESDDVPGTWELSSDGLTSTFTPSEELRVEGWYSLTVSADDLLGNDSEYPTGFGTWDFLLDTTHPELDDIVLNVYRRIPDAEGGVIYTPLKRPEIRVDFHDHEEIGSGFNAAVCDPPGGTFDVLVYSDEGKTVLVKGDLTRDYPRPTSSALPWGGTWVPEPGLELDDGDYFVEVVITDDAGNTRNPETYDLRFIVDTTPPDKDNSDAEVGFLNDKNNRRFANSRMLEVKWDRTPDPEAERGVPGSGLLGYEFEIWTKAENDTVPTGEYLQYGYTDYDEFNDDWLDYVKPTGTETEVYTMRRPAGFESGKSYGAWLRAYDMLHNASEWFDPPFVFDPDAPTEPGTPEVQGLGADRRTSDSTPELKWAHSTDKKAVAQSGVDLYEVQITVAGTTTWDIHYEVDIADEDVDKLDADDKALSGDFVWIVPAPLADGSYEVRVRAKDVAGNYSAWVKIDAAFIIDTTPPEVPGMPTTTSPTNSKQPVWTWAHIENAAGDLKQYNVYLDDVKMTAPVMMTTWPVAGAAITYETPIELDHGLHVLAVTSVDNLDNESAKSTVGHVFVDREEPAEPEMDPVAEWSKPGDIRFTWPASSDDTAVQYNFEYSLNGGVDWETPVTGLTGQSCVVDAGSLEFGAEVAGRVMAYDAVGNESNYCGYVSTKIDDKKPEVTTGDAPDPLSNVARPTWVWSATDVGSGVEYYIVTLDSELPTRIEYQSGDTRFTPSSNLADGSHVLKITAVDKVGNESGEVPFDAIAIDTTPPEVPGMPTTTSPTNSKQPVWTWAHIENAAGDLKQYNVYLDDVKMTAPVMMTTWPVAGAAITYETPIELDDGLHVLAVTSVDNLDNESAKSTVGHVLIDTKPPADPIMFDLEPFTNGNLHDSVTLVWTAVDDATRYTVEWWSEKASTSSLPKTRVVEVPTLTIDISGVEDGWTVFARVKAHDAVDNQSGWSNRVSTTIDDRGPAVTITNPAEAVTTNAATFTYEWTAEDDGSGVDYCTVVFNGGEHRVETPIESEPEVGSLNGESPVRTYAWTGTLIKGDNTFKVWATDKLGNKSEIVAVAPVVTQVLPQIVLVQPMPGAEYKINEISTIAFEVIGLVVDDDDQYLKPEVLLNGVKLDAWRIVSVVPPPVAKFYILLDNDVMAPGTMAIRITIGAGSELFIYAVDSERSGFGFGRLRPW